MKYKLTKEHRQWVEQLASVTGKNVIDLWLTDIKRTVADSQLDSLAALAGDRCDQARSFAEWVKGGVRPGHPH